MNGRKLAIPFEEAWADPEYPRIKFRVGEHGPELYFDRPLEEVSPVENGCGKIYFIVGMHKDEQAVFTWHPGQPLGRLEDEIGPGTAVKLHNG